MAKVIEKTGQKAFELIGKVKLTKNTFKLDVESKNSSWLRNELNLLLNCGNGNEVYSKLAGGFFNEEGKTNLCYVHGKKQKMKKENGVDVPVTREIEVNGKKVEVPVMTDDYTNQYTIKFEDRKDETILKDIGEGSFIKVGIVTDKDGKIFTEKFLSAYDAVAYIEEHKDKIKDKTLRVEGNLKYSLYNGNIQVEKEIKSIYISKVEEDGYKAVFTQTLLFDRKSFGKKDKDNNLFEIDAYVIEGMKKYGDKTIPRDYFMKGKKSANLPIQKMFYADNENIKKFIEDKRVTKGKITEAVFTGKIVEGKSKGEISLEDLDADMKFLVEQGYYTLETLAETMSVKSESVSQWIIERPLVKMEGEGENKKPKIMVEFDKYSEDDMVLGFLAEEEQEEQSNAETVEGLYESEDEKDEAEGGEDWMSALGIE